MAQTEPDVQAVQQTLLNECNNYIHNSLPTYLLDLGRIHAPPNHIQLSDIKLVSRDVIWKGIREQMEADLRAIPDSGREAWCQDRMEKYKHKSRYAILSHHWGADEPIFQQLPKSEEESPGDSGPPTEGVKKLLRFCSIAAEDYQCPYAWSDTCCINKQSSAELEEAVRSMYRWYKDSEICVVYLGASSLLDDLKNDPWFKRGWTLQELLAPRKIKLYNNDWRPINAGRQLLNDKDDESIRKAIEEITGIPDVDIRSFDPSCDRVSEKMTWMAPRKTTRIEDIAYSLIGIFDITMPISYGEGAWAFHRLMEVIAKRCFDPSFFAWCGTPSLYSLALPGSPSCYQLDSTRASLLQLRGFNDSSGVHGGDPSYKVMKTGLQVNVLVIHIDDASPFSDVDTYFLPARPQIAVPLSTPSMVPGTARLRAAKRGPNYALGVINFHEVTTGHGSVRTNFNYLCLLLKRHVSGNWRKERTKFVVVMKCRGNLKGKVHTVMLAHNAQLLS